MIDIPVENIPEELKALPQWVVWRLEEKEGDRPAKVPYNPSSGQRAASDNPQTWGSFTTALACYQKGQGRYRGLGFMFAQNGGLIGIDLDKCHDLETREIAPWARGILKEIDSYAELSPSGTGIHILAFGKLPPGGRRKGAVELYDQARYFTITGQHLEGTPRSIEDRQEEIEALHAQVFGQKRASRKKRASSSPTDLSDDELLLRAHRAANGDKFASLWAGHTSAYPSPSDADMALCLMLAFWTGKDAARMDRLFRGSGLMREKWDKKHYADGRTYGEATIERAISMTVEVYTPQGQTEFVADEPSPPPPGMAVLPVTLDEALTQADPRLLLQCLKEEEYGDARLLAHLYPGRLLYDHAEKSWYVWGGHAWCEDRSGLARRLVGGQVAAQYLHLAAEIRKQAEAEEQKARSLLENQAARLFQQHEALIKRARDLRRLGRVNNVLTFAGSFLGITGDEWDADPWLLGVKNGVVDLQTGQLQPGLPRDYIRVSAPTEWKGLDCSAPRFEQFIAEILARDPTTQELALDGELPAFLQRLLGYGITALTCEHIFPILWGPDGRNGKDTLLDALIHTLGKLAGSVSTDVVIAARNHQAGAATPHLIDLRGRRLVWASETNEGARLDTGQIKLVTGGGSISARPLHGRQTEFSPTHLLLLITNNRPHAPADDKATWERIHLIPFVHSFVDEPNPNDPREHKRDPLLKEKLFQETGGILAWLVRGCLAWQQEGLKPPKVVKLATRQYQQEEDTLSQFAEECCVVASYARAQAGRLYQAYKEWALDGGHRPMSSTTFGKRMGLRFTKVHGEKGWLYIGIGLKASETANGSADGLGEEGEI